VCLLSAVAVFDRFVFDAGLGVRSAGKGTGVTARVVFPGPPV
jgi:hypothetical protein